ncbi:MAG: VTT domain-containing protein [Firmicutes bacterium]|nr:VTT domain-containing protein [Bacillota bacterium]
MSGIRQAPNILIHIALRYGVIGLAVGTFFESLGIPFASLGLPLASGVLIQSGRATFLSALIVSTSGLLLGSIASYYIGYYGGNLARGVFHRPSSALMRRLTSYLDRYGMAAVALAQLYGPARTWISIPAGAARMDIKAFVTATTIGGIIYCAIAISFSLALNRIIKDIFRFIPHLTRAYLIIGTLILITTLVILFKMGRRGRRRLLR